jgi:hypothetical protein
MLRFVAIHPIRSANDRFQAFKPCSVGNQTVAGQHVVQVHFPEVMKIGMKNARMIRRIAAYAPLTGIGLLALFPACERMSVLTRHDATPAQEISPRPPSERQKRDDDDFRLLAPVYDSADHPVVGRLVAPPRVDDPDSAAAAPDVGQWASAFQFNAPIFSRADINSLPAGLSRRGNVIAIERKEDRGNGCQRHWYRVAGSGFICEDYGFFVDKQRRALPKDYWIPAARVEAPLPYDYATVVKSDSPIFWRMPKKEEVLDALAGTASASVRERSVAHHWVAIAKRFKAGGRAWIKTVRGYYMLEKQIKPVQSSQFAPIFFDDSPLGQALGPYGTAIAIKASAPIVDEASGDRIGAAERYARFDVNHEKQINGANHVCDGEGHCVAQSDIRHFLRHDPPAGVGPKTQWIHVDLTQQVLAAYTGREPQMATLISSGKGEFSTPLGTFYVHKKFHTRTMSGGDTPEGTYYVGQVPWTLYFWQSFAIHGAYWHDGFGETRSHGCVNVPPIAARWLFAWAAPNLPQGWHGKVGAKGPIVHVTGRAPPHPDEAT